MLTKNGIEKAWLTYGALVDKYAASVFEAKIRPWLEKRGYSFLSGNGTWCVWYTSKMGDRVYLYEEDLPKKIVSLLTQEIPGVSEYDLGSIMPDFYHEREKMR